MYVPWGISRVLEDGRQILWEEELHGDIFGQKITSVLVNILLAHHPPFLFWFHTGFYFSHVTHITTSWIQGRPRQRLPTFLTSQRDKVLSAELVTTVLEKGRNSMLLTESLWPRRVYLHLSLQEKETAMQHPPLRVTWYTDSSRGMQDTLCASLEKWTLTMTPHPNTAPQRQLQTPAHWCLLPSNEGWSRKA